MAEQGEKRSDTWQRAILSPAASIRDVINNLDQVAIQIVMIADETGVLLGTISDGDVRRGLLRGLNLDSCIDSIAQKTPLVVPEAMDREMVMQLMRANKIRQIPIVDHKNHVVGLHLWDDVSGSVDRPNLMIIMAGGKGTRLRPHTENCPKPMLHVGGRPMLEHIIERAKAEGFCDFIIAVRYLGHMIEDHFGNGENFDVHIEYLRENEALGTAGALSLIEETPSLPFVVTNGDVITDIRYGELLDFHTRHEAGGTMAVRLHEWQHPFGVVHMQGVDITGFEEKPVARSHINAGVYALAPEALSCLVKNKPCDMPTLFQRLQEAKHRTVAYPMHEPWLDVGRPDDLAMSNHTIKL